MTIEPTKPTHRGENVEDAETQITCGGHVMARNYGVNHAESMDTYLELIFAKVTEEDHQVITDMKETEGLKADLEEEAEEDPLKIKEEETATEDLLEDTEITDIHHQTKIKRNMMQGKSLVTIKMKTHHHLIER